MLVSAGKLERVARGVYSLPNQAISEYLLGFGPEDSDSVTATFREVCAIRVHRLEFVMRPIASDQVEQYTPGRDQEFPA